MGTRLWVCPEGERGKIEGCGEEMGESDGGLVRRWACLMRVRMGSRL